MEEALDGAVMSLRDRIKPDKKKKPNANLHGNLIKYNPALLDQNLKSEGSF